MNEIKSYWVQTQIFIRATDLEDARKKVKNELMTKKLCFLVNGAKRDEFEERYGSLMKT